MMAKWSGRLTVTLFIFLLAGCGLFFSADSKNKDGSPTDEEPEDRDVYLESVPKVDFGTASSKTINLSNLVSNDVFLVSINRSDSVAFGIARSATSTESPPPDSSSDSDTFKEYAVAQRFNANPPPVTKTMLSNRSASSVSFSEGATKKFWVESTLGGSRFEEKNATLRKQGIYGNIWVIDEDYAETPITDDKKITTNQASEISAKFDIIYPLETNLLGYEYGGGSGGGGGVDGDNRIQILVYDINKNLDTSGASVVGFFWSKDFYSQADLDVHRLNIKSNESEIFYIDSGWADRSSPNQVYSTLVHEFQHMISFNQKFVIHDKISSTWYGEMLSMMAEDVISPLIGIGPDTEGHPLKSRIPNFIRHYDEVGAGDWDDGNVLSSYANNFVFGAYLMRNWGGAELLSNMMHNDLVDTASITSALNSITPGMSFSKALNAYGTAFIYNNRKPHLSGISFDRSLSKTINGKTYTASAFNICDRDGLYRSPTSTIMKKNAITVEKLVSGKFGAYSITLNRPSNPNVDLYIMVR
jgi:hypothetical protein